MQLVKSPIIFDPAAHTYHTPDGVQLQGITGMLRRQLFPDEYSDVPQAVLRRAAERGHAVHQLLELVDDLGLAPSDNADALAYIRLKEAEGLRPVASEYLVSDGTRFASAIDKVYEGDADGSFTLADIKTTYRLNEEYVRWQLSVYAYLFELQNPGARASRLLALWIRDGRASAYPMERIPADVITALLDAEAAGRQFENPLAVDTTLPAKYRQMEQAICETERQARYWTERKKALAEGLMQAMVLAGAYEWEGRAIKVSRRKDGIRKDFNKKQLEKDHPDIYAKYITETPVSGSITLKIKQQEP